MSSAAFAKGTQCLPDMDMHIQRRLALLERGTFASPTYIDRFGAPKTPDHLEGHRMVGLMSYAI